MGGTAAQLALLVVVVNLVACLIASRAMTVAEQGEAVAGLPSPRPVIVERGGGLSDWIAGLTSPRRERP